MNVINFPKIIVAVALLATFYSCNKGDSKKHQGTALDPQSNAATLDTTKYNAEYLPYDAVKVNGKFPLQSSYKEFLAAFGKPDSLVQYKDDECAFFEEPYEYIYFKGNMFYLVKDSAIFQKVNFQSSPDFELTAPALTLNKNTTLAEVEKLFPNAVRKIRTIDNAEGRAMRWVSLGPSKTIADDFWILEFDGEKLVSVEMYSPC